MTLQDEIREVLNRNSAERGSNTPDYVLAEFLRGCLEAFDHAVKDRERWYGRGDGPPPQLVQLAKAGP